tara:strand:- start:2865 stop:4574 length:1710 start_codon:yes stop_codon:yes gene_type:complete
MRLHKFTIGSEEEGAAHRFKNLKNLTVDFDQDHWVTIVIGRNGTGKSNVLEALSIIFGELISEGRPAIPFSFKLTYSIGKASTRRLVHIDHAPDRGRASYQISARSYPDSVQQKRFFAQGLDELHSFDPNAKISLNLLRENAGYLPEHVFGYYSGESSRMRAIFEKYLAKYDSKLRNGQDPGAKRLFFALPEHSQFVLLAFLIQESDGVKNFLDKELGLDPGEGIESVLFVLREPPWSKNDDKEGDDRFWNAKGVVQTFLDRLLNAAIAPVQLSRRTPVSPWNNKTLEYRYLFLKNIDALRELVGRQEPASFFRDLESTHVSQLIQEVRIRVRLNKNDGAVTFRELSEGEQQLLTVLGLMLFTAQHESLFLLDEPDTHLNPRWSVDYIRYLKNFVVSDDAEESHSHVILTTHNPIAIADLEREQVQILQLDKSTEARRVVASFPEEAPRGMGYAAIVTSDMFGINSALDKTTTDELEKQRILGGKLKLSSEEQRELDELNEKLNLLGFRFSHPDEEYGRFLRARQTILAEQYPDLATGELIDAAKALSQEERETLAREIVQRIAIEEEL